MSHHVTSSGRPYVECDELTDASGVPLRCGRQTFGRRDSLPHHDDDRRLNLFDLPDGWSVAPYSPDFDHGATRKSLLDGRDLPPFPHLVGVKGDLHTCPACNRRRRR